MRLALTVFCLFLLAASCMRTPGSRPGFARARAAATFYVPQAALQNPLVLVAYGDMRFTNPSETSASNPGARQALVAKIAAERPAAIFINGDVTWHGVPADYAIYRDETARWREQHLRVYPALGNHELSGCEQPACLERWWSEFPDINGRRWYSVALGDRVLAVALDSNESLMPDSEQRVWLEQQLAALGSGVRLVLLVMHHPPLADVQTAKMADHNPRPNEQALADYLDGVARRIKARIIVTAGHIHNYERLQRAGVVYLVSGGGGARPYEVDRTPEDQYQGGDFPNFHYMRFELGARAVVGEMIRFGGTAATPDGRWEARDRFELTLPP